MKIELPERIKETCYVFMYTELSLAGTIGCCFYDMSDDASRLLIASFKVDIAVPKDTNFNQLMLDKLKVEREGIVTKYSIELKRIDDNIKDLQCLTHDD